MVYSFRSKPIGWRGESHRHYLAAKGISSQVRHHYFAANDPLKGNRESSTATPGLGRIKSAQAKGWTKDALIANPQVAEQFNIDVNVLRAQKAEKKSSLPEFSPAMVVAARERAQERTERQEEAPVENIVLPSRIEVETLTEVPTPEEEKVLPNFYKTPRVSGPMTPGVPFFGEVDFERGPQ